MTQVKLSADYSPRFSRWMATWQPGDTRKSLLARADAAMYRAKHGGRNRVES